MKDHGNVTPAGGGFLNRRSRVRAAPGPSSVTACEDCGTIPHPPGVSDVGQASTAPLEPRSKWHKYAPAWPKGWALVCGEQLWLTAPRGPRRIPRAMSETLRPVLTRLKPPSDCDCGVYFLIRDGAVVYVGQSTNIHSRMGQHVSLQKITYDSALVLPVSGPELKSVEEAFIKWLRPPGNCRPARSSVISENLADILLGFGFEDAKAGLDSGPGVHETLPVGAGSVASTPVSPRGES